MAVFDGLPGVEVTVLQGTHAMAEYDAEAVEVSPLATMAESHQHNRTTTKYIESVDDAEFAINFTVVEAYNLDCPFLSFKTEVDGTWIGSPSMNSKALKVKKQWSRILSGPESKSVDHVLIKQMKFAKLGITDDCMNNSNIRNQTEQISTVGEIIVKVFRLGPPNPGRAGQTLGNLGTAQYGDPVHEKALKGEAKTHGTVLGATKVRHEKTELIRAEKLDGEDFPVAIFKFIYRSKKALQSLLILPRTPSPEPERFTINTMSPDEAALVESFVQQHLGSHGRQKLKDLLTRRPVKREITEDDEDDDIQPRKRTRIGKLKITTQSGKERVEIDLTGD